MKIFKVLSWNQGLDNDFAEFTKMIKVMAKKLEYSHYDFIVVVVVVVVVVVWEGFFFFFFGGGGGILLFAQLNKANILINSCFLLK